MRQPDEIFSGKDASDGMWMFDYRLGWYFPADRKVVVYAGCSGDTRLFANKIRDGDGYWILLSKENLDKALSREIALERLHNASAR